MTIELQDPPASDTNAELLKKIDEFLTNITHQTIVPQADVVNFTLDLRQIINRKEASS
jgi:hypothetical protein